MKTKAVESPNISITTIIIMIFYVFCLLVFKFINTLSIISPTVDSSIPFGRTIPVLVDNSDGDISTYYTATFSSSSGTFLINGLVQGITYNLVPAGIYGNTTLVVTATGGTTALVSFQIINYNANIVPIFIPSRLS